MRDCDCVSKGRVATISRDFECVPFRSGWQSLCYLDVLASRKGLCKEGSVAKKKEKSKSVSFEDSVGKLAEVVRDLEDGKLSLSPEALGLLLDGVYLRRGMPVLVIEEFEYWRRVRDVDGAEGWLHKSLIRSRRTAIITGETRDLRQLPADDAPVVAKAEVGVLAQLLACKGAWCQVEANDLRGWLPRSQFFGALKDEVFD